MKHFLAGLGLFVLILVFGFLLAYPTMWAMNYLFASSFLIFVFGGPLTAYKAWLLNALASLLFKSTITLK